MIREYLTSLAASTDQHITERELRTRIALIIRLRWVVLALLLLIVAAAYAQGYVISENQFVETARGLVQVPFRITDPEGLVRDTGQRLYREAFAAMHGSLNLQALLTSVAFLLNLAYHLLRHRVRDLGAFIRLQLTLDVLTYAGVVYNTGGIFSPFIFLFYFPIIGAGILSSPRLGIVLTTACAILHGVIAGLPVTNLFSPLAVLSPGPGYYPLTLTVQLFSFFLVAYLSGILVRLLHRREEQLLRANSTLANSVQQLGAIFEVTEHAAPGISPDAAVALVLRVLLNRFTLQRAIYFRVDTATNRLVIAAVLPADAALVGTALPLRDARGNPAGVSAGCALSGEPVNITDPHDPRINRDTMRQVGDNPFAVVPVIVNEKVVGVLGVDRARADEPIGDDLFRLLSLLARQLSLILSRHASAITP